MTDSVSFDFSEVTKLAADLGKVPESLGPFLYKAFQVTATNVKKDAAKTVSKDKFFKAAAAGIDYDIDGSVGSDVSTLTAEVGYNKSRRNAAKLGNLREFGAPASPNSLAPSNDLVNALQKNQLDFGRGIDLAAQDAEKAAGL